MKDTEIQHSIERKLSALVALLAAFMENPELESRRKVEIILSDAEFGPAEIGRIVGKKTDTVIKTIKRAK